MIPDKQKERLLEMVGNTPKKSRASIKHAWMHIEKATVLVGIDNEMAAFRAITAEEEAATGVIHALQGMGYDRANLLSPRDHKHKSGIWHLLTIISAFMHGVNSGSVFNGKISEGDGEDVGKLVISIPSPIPGDGQWINPIPPLNFSISSDGKNISFQKQAQELASLHNKNRLEKFISQEANLRNKLIYASPEGLPSVTEAPTDFISERKRRVAVLTYAYLLISQYQEKQLFVQQSLDAYLVMLERNQAEHLHHAL